MSEHETGGHGTQGLLEAVEQLVRAVTATRFPLAEPGVEGARKDRGALINQAEDYLLPRLRRQDAPLLAVVGGSTGSGKSTLVNSFAEQELSPAGVLRPTTRAPVLVCHPGDAHWFTDDRILPRLSRVAGEETEHHLRLTVAKSPAVIPGLALLDAPDLDSVVEANRTLANELLAAADVWLFVTTPSRYADAVPWEALQTAQARGTSVAVVLDRVPPGADEIADHLGQLLRKHGLQAAPLMYIKQTELVDGLLPAEAVRPIRAWAEELARSAESRATVADQTMDGTLNSLQPRTTALVRHAAKQDTSAAGLREELVHAYETGVGEVITTINRGAALRGESLARWQEFVNTGGLTAALRARDGGFRARLSGRKGPAPGHALAEAIAHTLAAVFVDGTETAAELAAARWRATTAGEVLLEGRDDLASAAPEAPRLAADLVARWQAGVLDAVRTHNTNPRATSQSSASAAILVMAGVLVTDEMIANAEAHAESPSRPPKAPPPGTLRRVFGDPALRELVEASRAELVTALRTLLDADRGRYDTLLAEAGVGEPTGEALRLAAAGLEEAHNEWYRLTRPHAGREAHWAESGVPAVPARTGAPAGSPPPARTPAKQTAPTGFTPASPASGDAGRAEGPKAE